MLHPHLIAVTRPLARPENIALWRDYRVTVLGPRLFRLEKGPKFRDGATQCVWFRDMPPTDHVTRESAGEFAVQTAACTLILREAREDCEIVLGGRHIPLDGAGNLLGTCRTLDGYDGTHYRYGAGGEVELGRGVCSETGVALLDDAASLTLGEDGEVKDERGAGTDEYIFAFGTDFLGAIGALYAITGPVPLLPRFALGNWWSRYHAYTDREYLRLMNTFSEREVPFTVATVDMDWHYSAMLEEELGIVPRADERGEGMLGWTGYTWNKYLFPDHRSFLSELNARGLKVTLNLHPADGVRRWEAQYGDMAAALGRDADGSPVPFDFTDPAFINNYFDLLHHPYEAEGVAFWWIDWQQGTGSALAGLDPLWALNHYHYLDIARGEAPLILSRYGGIGSHRYPVGFSGDTFVTWDTLAYLPYFTMTASNCGYAWWSHDIGGHQCGEKSGELYIRFVQLGVFSPVNRLHCSSLETMTKEPQVYENGAGLIAEEFLRLRHRMIPYLYTMSYRLHTEGVPLVEPLYYRDHVKAAFEERNAYRFGSELLVAPVTKKAERDGYARVDVWLPAGSWTDIFTGDAYTMSEGGAHKTLLRTLDSIPVLAKAGAILPLSADRGASCAEPMHLEVWAFTGTGKFSLYERRGGDVFTDLSVSETQTGTRFAVSMRGEGEIPAGRVLTVCFKDVREGCCKLFADGNEAFCRDVSSNCLKVEFPIEKGHTYVIEATHVRKTTLETLFERAQDVLTRAEMPNERKRIFFAHLKRAASEEEFVSAVQTSRLKACVKARLLETL